MSDGQAAGDRALALADAHSERASRAYALRLLGEVASRRDVPDLPAAEDRLREALILAGELGMRPPAARCQAELERLPPAR